MWPWGHLAVGYVLYSALAHLSGDSPRDYPTVALALGTQFPDVVDKPLAWSLGVLPSGRSLAHSLITATLLLVCLRWLLVRYGYASVSTAFGIGYLVHIAGDAFVLVVTGEYYYLRFLAWPLVPIGGATERGFAAHLSSLDWSTFSFLDVGLFLVVFGLWVVDGAPGMRPVLAASRRAYRRLSAN